MKPCAMLHLIMPVISAYEPFGLSLNLTMALSTFFPTSLAHPPLIFNASVVICLHVLLVNSGIAPLAIRAIAGRLGNSYGALSVRI